MRRRQFLRLSIQSVLLGFASCLGACTAAGRRVATTLRQSIEQLQGRDYAEVGVCMLLTGEDLHAEIERNDDLGGARLAAVLDDFADDWLAAKPDATEDDVAALVELIADRDFAAGGGEFPS